MYEAFLREISLSPELVIKGYIPGEPDCNYEKYILEFLNGSDWFMKKTKGQPFFHPASETHGECDCISGAYSLDLKLVLSNSELRRKSRPRDSGQNPVTRLHAALRNYDVSGLKVLDSLQCGDEEGQICTFEERMERDVKFFLNNLETKKHLLLFHGYEMFFDTEESLDFGTAMGEMETALNFDFRESMKYRDQKVGMETYMGCFYEQFFVMFRWIPETAGFRWIDRVEKEKSPVYLKLCSYIKGEENGAID